MMLVLVLSAACIIVPLRYNATEAAAAPAFYFAAIGIGFIFIEIAQLQMLTIFLGHPTYSLAVVLFTLLIAGGIGSSSAGGRVSDGVRLTALLAVLAGFAMFGPATLRACTALATPLRIAVAVALVAPQGFFMGMPLPIGMRAAAVRNKNTTAWLWGINGAASVCGSVGAMILALRFGILAVVWAGVVAYGVAAIAHVVHASQRQESPASPLAQTSS